MGGAASSEHPPKYEALTIPVYIQATDAMLHLPVPPDNCFRADEWPELAAALGESKLKGMTIHRLYKKSKASPIVRAEVRAHKEYWTFRNQELEKIETLVRARQKFAMAGSVVTYAQTDKLCAEATEAFKEKYLC